jgi:hypothetical protein
MRELLSVIAGLIALAGYVPYAVDIIHGRVQPARSARLMFALLLIITLLQQRDLHSGLVLFMTVGEAVGSLAILGMAIKNGIGGLGKIDVACYILLILDLTIWLTTNHALLALHLSILADLIAFTPTLVKTWREPYSETPIFYITGIIAGPLNVVAAGHYAYSIILFPLYIGLANITEIILIVIRRSKIPSLTVATY